MEHILLTNTCDFSEVVICFVNNLICGTYLFSDIHNLTIGKPKSVVDSEKDSNSQFLGGSLHATTSHLNG